MITTVIFDFWGVLATKRFRIFDLVKETLSVDESTHPIFMEYYTKVELGIIDEGEFWQQLCDRLKVSPPEQPQAWSSAYKEITNFDGETLAIASGLRASSYRVAILSNMDPGIGTYLRENNYLKDFEGLFLSYETRLAKPDERAYSNILKVLEVMPQETIFIDDRLENVTAARKLGMQAAVFRGSERLATDLRLFLNE